MSYSKSEKDRDKKIAICGFVSAMLILSGVIIARNQIFDRIKPKIEGLNIDERVLTIVPENEELRLVYCVSESTSSAGCKWENTREFDLEHDGTYYSFIKNLDNGTVSDPFELPYKYVDFSELRI